MGIEYLDKTHAKLVVSFGSGKNRVRKVKRITYTKKSDAQRQYDEFRKQIESEVNVDSDLTVKSLLDWYIEHFKISGGKESTVRAYNVASKPIIKYFQRYKAKDISLYMIERFIAHEAKSKSPKTIKNEISLLSSSFKHAIRRGVLIKNPCEYATIPRQIKPDINVLTNSEIQSFIDALDSTDIDFKVFCELALFCGLRKSEILGLHYEDISDAVTIKRVRLHLNGKDIVQTPKTRTSARTIAVPAFILADIATLKKSHELRAGKCEYLIRNAWGEPPSSSWCDKHMQALVQDNNLPHITVHGLRHTYASMLISEGVPISEVSAQLGHASVDITLRVYTHLFTDASTASKAISESINEKWAPKGHR